MERHAALLLEMLGIPLGDSALSLCCCEWCSKRYARHLSAWLEESVLRDIALMTNLTHFALSPRSVVAPLALRSLVRAEFQVIPRHESGCLSRGPTPRTQQQLSLVIWQICRNRRLLGAALARSPA